MAASIGARKLKQPMISDLINEFDTAYQYQKGGV
jgi:hypothetical protein